MSLGQTPFIGFIPSVITELPEMSTHGLPAGANGRLNHDTDKHLPNWSFQESWFAIPGVWVCDWVSSVSRVLRNTEINWLVRTTGTSIILLV